MTVTHEDLDARLARGEDRFHSIEGKIDAIATALEPLPQMQSDIADTKELVQAWKAIALGGRFLKWIGSIAAAFAALWVVVKAGAAVLLR